MRGALSAAQSERIHLQFEMSTFFLGVQDSQAVLYQKAILGGVVLYFGYGAEAIQSNSLVPVGSEALEHSLPLKNRLSTSAGTQLTNGSSGSKQPR